jgi:hypothetical protein
MLTIIGVFPQLFLVGQMLKFVYKLHVKNWPTVYLDFRVKILINIIFCELNYVRLYQSLDPRMECIRATNRLSHDTAFITLKKEATCASETVVLLCLS